MKRYWQGTKENGEIVNEKNNNWEEIKNDLKNFQLVMEDKDIMINLPRGLRYSQSKTASVDFSGNHFSIESRNVSFELGNNTVTIKVSENNNNINVELS